MESMNTLNFKEYMFHSLKFYLILLQVSLVFSLKILLFLFVFSSFYVFNYLKHALKSSLDDNSVIWGSWGGGANSAIYWVYWCFTTSFFLLLFYNFVRTHPKPVFASCQIPSEQFWFCFWRLPFMLTFQLGFLDYAGRINSDPETRRREKFVLYWLEVFRVLAIPESQYQLLYFPILICQLKAQVPYTEEE